MEKLVSLADFAPALRELANGEDSDFVIIGGLAVGAWVQYFGIAVQDVIYSKDIDLRGGRMFAQAIGKSMQLHGCKIKGFVTANRKEPPGLGKNYIIPLDLADGRSTVIEILEAMPWVDEGKDRPYGFGVLLDGLPLLDPYSLFIGKLHAWHHRTSEDLASNDRIHLNLLAKVIPLFSTEAQRRGMNIEERSRALHYYLTSHSSPLNELDLLDLKSLLLSHAP